ncbi:hypothetical protein CKA32_006357 [Geitlerinema sp. FC II]|nr:hypothetical protein CKA32_006357 [Geitlerinema sp. FC II]
MGLAAKSSIDPSRLRSPTWRCRRSRAQHIDRYFNRVIYNINIAVFFIFLNYNKKYFL